MMLIRDNYLIRAIHEISGEKNVLRTYPKTSNFQSEKSNRFVSFSHAVSGNPLSHGINGFPIKDFGNDMAGFRIGTKSLFQKTKILFQ